MFGEQAVTCLQPGGEGAAAEVTAEAGVQVFTGAAAEHLLRAREGPVAEGCVALWGVVCIVAVTCAAQQCTHLSKKFHQLHSAQMRTLNITVACTMALR